MLLLSRISPANIIYERIIRWRRLSLIVLFYHYLIPRNTLRVFRIEMAWKLCENVASALLQSGIHVECL